MATFLTKLQRRIYRNRSISFTPAGIRFILLTLAVGLAAVNTGNNLLYLILGMMLSLIMVSGILSEQSLHKISVAWRFPSRLFAQQPVPVEMRITNGKRLLPSYSFRIDDGNAEAGACYTPKLSAGDTMAVSRTVCFDKRGLRTLPAVTSSTHFPFGFICKSLIRPPTDTVLVYPRVLQAPPGIQFTRPHAGRDRENRRRGAGTELHNLREYTPADDARSIHWKASARESRLLLKEFESEDDSRVYLTLSPRVSDIPVADGVSETPEEASDAFERAVEIAAALAWEFTRRGCSVGLQTLEDPVSPDGRPPFRGKILAEAQSTADHPDRPSSARRPFGRSELRYSDPTRDRLSAVADPTLIEEVRDLDAILQTLALIQPVSAGFQPVLFQHRIAALMSSAVTSARRVLILPFPDPLWDRYCGSFSDVLVASEPRFREWARQGIRPTGRRP